MGRKKVVYPTGRERRQPTSVRKEQIMDAAEKIFLRKGVVGTSVDEIVKQAGMAKGSFYLHFPTKEHLYAGMRERFIDNFAALLQTNMDRYELGDWKGRLHGWVEGAVIGYQDKIALHHLVFHELRAELLGKTHTNAGAKLLAELLESGTQAGAFDVGDAHTTAIMLFYALHGLLDDARESEPYAVNRKRLVKALDGFFQRVVGLKAS